MHWPCEQAEILQCAAAAVAVVHPDRLLLLAAALVEIVLG